MGKLYQVQERTLRHKIRKALKMESNEKLEYLNRKWKNTLSNEYWKPKELIKLFLKFEQNYKQREVLELEFEKLLK